MSMLFVSGDEIRIVPFDKKIIKYETSMEIPLYFCKIANRKGIYCFPISANSLAEFKAQVENKTAKFYICYSEKDNHWNGYEELESFVISNLIHELQSRT